MDPTVTLLSHTANPIETVYVCWAASRHNDKVPTPEELAHWRDVVNEGAYTHYWGHLDKRTWAEREELARDCDETFLKILNGGIPVAENVDFVFLLEGVSIALREQMVRHRVGTHFGGRVGMDIVPDLVDSTWWSQSMRVLPMGEFAAKEAYHTPASISEYDGPTNVSDIYVDPLDAYASAMHHAEEAYNALVLMGIPLEDARNVIPLAATHRLTWKINLAALAHVVGKRGCWILQLGIWEPVIRGMIEAIATKIDPVFRRLISPPCLKGADFTGCHFKLDNERRIQGEDEIPPCPLYLHHHRSEAQEAEQSVVSPAWRMQDNSDWFANSSPEQRNKAHDRELRMAKMRRAYSSLWGRDVDTGGSHAQMPLAKDS